MSRDVSSSPQVQKASRVRFGVLGFVCALSMITYLDRVCFGTAIQNIISDFREDHGIYLSPADFKWAIFAFAFAYAAFEIPSGWLGDVYGPRGVLIRIVLWWSFFTALTASVGLSLGSFVIGMFGLAVIRFLFGMGEAGAYPNITRALHNWFPFKERGFAQGAVWMSGRLMGGLTPLIWLLLVERAGLSWRSTFLLFGALGVTWCIAFALWFRNRPQQVSAVNQAELELINAGRNDTRAAHADVPWLKLVSNPNLWALCLMYFCGAYAWYFNITYLPSFLKDHYAEEVDPNSWLFSVFKGGPLIMGAAACLVGGWLTDALIRRTGNRKWGRRLFGVCGQGLCALCFLVCLIAPNVYIFVLALSLAAFWNDMTMGACWAVCQDIGRRYAAIVAGFMNTVGNLGGAVAGLLTGFLLEGARSVFTEGPGRPLQELIQTQRLAAELSPDNAAALGVMQSVYHAQVVAAELPGYQLGFLTFAAASLVAVVLWLRIDATKPVTLDA
jgi:MFS family permease